MAAARAILCELPPQNLPSSKKESAIPKLRSPDPLPDSSRILLQPRLCTLRSYGNARDVIMKNRKDDWPESPFFASLSDYIDNSRKSHDFEILSGRFAMIAFATTVAVETVTGNSVFTKMDLEKIAQAVGVCVGAVACAAAFAWFSSARTRVGRIFNLSCNQFVDALIDNLVDGLFYEDEFHDS